ncbi:thiol-disulfide oxidoreductase DCC family protein [Marinobacter sp.]|uniref:thiol-disulfide oxidoreductase DCC family protein n=1 Tax=Marinobacter sp. TaxID=50741 RepID=UPI003850FC11
MDTLFYDSQCPLCRREIKTLQRLQSGGLTFSDIHRPAESGASLPSRESLLRRLHLLKADGNWAVGLEANVQAWSHTPLGWLFRPLLWPGIRAIAGKIYERWADRRYERRYACDSCGSSGS